MEQLGSLEKVALREVWEKESSDFTPWLACEGNIKLLSETLRLELEVEAQEKSVGPYSADILCKDTANNSWVLIENQLEATDHTHLGQLITYAAGLDAVTVVWIAERFSDEHRAALDWLNEITAENVNFFALEIELWRIENSPIAPKFNVISKPNDWSRTVKTTAAKAELTETKKLQLEYWTALKDLIEESESFVKCQKPQPQHWTNFAVGRSNFYLLVRVNTRDKEVGAHLVINGDNKQDFFYLLETDYKEQIEKEIGIELNWRALPDAKESQIVVPPLSADPKDTNDWQRQHVWIKKTIEKMYSTLSPIIKRLDLSEYHEIN